MDHPPQHASGAQRRPSAGDSEVAGHVALCRAASVRADEPRDGVRVKARQRRRGTEQWILRLYVAGNTARGSQALRNLEAVCEEHLSGRYRIEVVDLLKQPQLARGDQIVALPTLVRRLPPPMKKIIGDLSNQERLLVGLDLRRGGPRRQGPA